MKHTSTITALLLLFLNSAIAKSTNHSHDGRAHLHPLPQQGISHRHGNGSLGSYIEKGYKVRKETLHAEKIPNGKITLYRTQNKNRVRKNPDGTKFYDTTLFVTIEYKGRSTSKKLHTGLYTRDDTSWNGMSPTMLFDPVKQIITIFSNGKTSNESHYGMEGYAYRLEDWNGNWKKEVVFSNSNYGWYPYFTTSIDGQPTLWHFSFHEYYAVESTRSPNGSWSNNNAGGISPNRAKKRYGTKRSILIASEKKSSSRTQRKRGNQPLDQLSPEADRAIVSGLFSLGKWIFGGGSGSSSSSSSSSSPTYASCNYGDTCHEVVRFKDNGNAIVRCTKGPLSQYNNSTAERCLSYSRKKGLFASDCSTWSQNEYRYSLKEAAYRACD